MTLKSRLQKLSEKLSLGVAEVHCFGWADCTWSESEGLIRWEGESMNDFCMRVNKVSKKQYLWFN
jgi:hypothetical protein